MVCQLRLLSWQQNCVKMKHLGWLASYSYKLQKVIDPELQLHRREKGNKVGQNQCLDQCIGCWLYRNIWTF